MGATGRSTPHWVAVVIVCCGLAAVLGCGRREITPTPPGGATPPVTQKRPIVMAPVTIPEGYNLGTYANRGITDWKATRSADGTSVRCTFRSTAEERVHYGGVSLPIPGSKSFHLRMEFQNGAAIQALFVAALSPEYTDAGMWGSNCRESGVGLKDNQEYVWQFTPGEPAGPQFWGRRGKTDERAAVHVWVSVDPGEEVSLAIVDAGTEM